MERVEWLNMIIASMWPHIGEYTDAILKYSKLSVSYPMAHLLHTIAFRTKVEPEVRGILEQKKLGGFKFAKIHFGKVPPRILGVKVYETPRKDEIIMDLDVEYYGDIEIGICLMKVIKRRDNYLG